MEVFPGEWMGWEVRVARGRVAERSERVGRTRLGKHRKGIPGPTHLCLGKSWNGTLPDALNPKRRKRQDPNVLAHLNFVSDSVEI